MCRAVQLPHPQSLNPAPPPRNRSPPPPMPAMIRPRQAMQGLFCMTPQISDADSRRNFDDYGFNPQSFGFSFIDLTAGSAAPDIDPHFSFLTGQPGIQVLLFRDSCKGLILFENRRREPSSGRLGYIVCNPTTKHWESVPACGSSTFLNYTYLAFDPAVSSHFHLVQFQVKDDEDFLSVHAYSSETRTWSVNQIDHQVEGAGQLGWRRFRFNLGDSNPQCPFVNGFLHLMVWDQGEMKVVALDVQGKAARMIPVPHMDDTDRRHMTSYFGESQGHLHHVTQEIVNAPEGKYKMSIWVLQDYGAQGGWVLKDTLHTHEAFGEDIEFEVVDFHQDRNVVFFIHPLEHELVAYDMDRKLVSLVATFDAQKELAGTARYVPCV